MHNKLHSFSLLFVILSVFLFNACDNVDNGQVSFSFYSGGALNKVAADSIKLDSAKFILYDIKIKDLSNKDTTSAKVLKVGPFVVNLNMNGMTTDFAVGEIPPGSYDRVKFEIHKLNDNEPLPDSEFVEGTYRYAGIIRGTFNSQPFVYKYQNSAKQDLHLTVPVQVVGNAIANLTITVDPYSWFMQNGIFINPSDPANKNVIEENIKASFKKVVIDNNHDGLPD